MSLRRRRMGLMISRFGVGRAIFRNLGEFPKLVESGKLRPLRYSVIEGLDVEKVNAALDDIGASKGVRWHIRM